MRWSPIFITSVLTILSGTSARPTSNVTSTLYKRSVVCGLNVRTAVAEDCLDNRPLLNFAQSGSLTRPTVSRVAVPNDDEIPPGAACDHVVELQVLQEAMLQSGMCQVVAVLARIGISRATQLQAMANVINGPGNLIFLDSRINRGKASYVRNAMAGAQITNEVVANVAVNAYLRDQTVSSSSLVIAQHLDATITAILNDAVARAQQIPPLHPQVRPPNQQIADQQNFRNTVLHFASIPPAQRITVTRLWSRVLRATLVSVDE
ncbi:hypothetical protein SISNIDRAFT_450448 [Sistotremastrum niveocremeum HHB9708]|uniref:Uncharacterized protein n=1 Tax=Sistotremastrum niveocremeum HHB9708 TaxID=1314777 RepID=A0A164YA14_9AGAM|nr:hypothetical protein SISNIDRAFT_450448 [Sistotremastrum niveocremeum HHB9708]